MRKKKDMVVSVRMPSVEAHAVIAAAEASGMSLSEYAREAIASWLRVHPSRPSINIGASTSHNTILVDRCTWSTAADAHIETMITR